MTVMSNAGGTSSNGGNGYDRPRLQRLLGLPGGSDGATSPAAPAASTSKRSTPRPVTTPLTGTARTTLPDDGEGEEREEIAGGHGDDVIDDGGGRDLVEGDDGNDTIDSLDQVVDVVDCGLGTDTVDCRPRGRALQLRDHAGAAGRDRVRSLRARPSSRTAHFEFTTTDPSPPPGGFQCRIDGQPDFTTCTSPVDLANLSDGAHTFRVRYDPTGTDPPGPVTERTWTVDATAPSVVFDSAPSGRRERIDGAVHLPRVGVRLRRVRMPARRRRVLRLREPALVVRPLGRRAHVLGPGHGRRGQHRRGREPQLDREPARGPGRHGLHRRRGQRRLRARPAGRSDSRGVLRRRRPSTAFRHVSRVAR